VLGVILALAAAPPPPPWEVWRDLARLAVATPGHQVLARSSHCPSGCRYDRTDAGDPRFLRIEGDEQVVFEETGPGAIVRIWMTQSDALDPDIRLRVRVDGENHPRIDLKVAELFGGRRPPFVPPLVADRERSSGGYVSYVPVPYRRGCKVSLVGASDRRLWFQFTFHRLRDASGVTTFRGDEDLAALARLLGAQGEDPWGPDAGTLENRQVELRANGTEVLRRYETPGTLTGLRLRVPSAAWPTVRLRLELDGQPRVNLSLEDLFGTSPTPGMRSSLVGRDAADVLYLWLPIPFQRSAVVRLVNPGGTSVPVWYEVRRRPGPPLPGSLLFGARALRVGKTLLDSDFPLLDGLGRGRWVGLYAELQSVGIDGREYLEGDERIYVDGSAHPALHGTGVEDFIGGGFYFERGPFRLGTHGSPAHDVLPNGEDRTSMYRLFLTDAIPFASALKAGLESGPTGDLYMRARRVAWFYADRTPALARRAVLDLGDPESRRLAAYAVESDEVCRDRTGAFEGEPEVPLDYVSCRRTAGASRFTFRVEAAPALRLRRRFEATAGEQRAHVFVNGAHVGTYPPVEPNAFRSLRETDLDLPPLPGGTLRFTIVPADGQPFTEVRWELWTAPAERRRVPDAR
jgi:hypothetical protein